MAVEATDIRKGQGIQVISRAAGILRLLGQETEGLSLGQISRHVQLPRSTVQRIVSALASEGFIATSAHDGSIKLGPEIQSLARAGSIDITKRIRPLMKSISDQTGETVDLAVLEGNQMRFIDQIVGSQRLRTVSSIGESFPLTITANGKAALACLAPEYANELISNEQADRKPSRSAQKSLKLELEAIRNGELARDENEHTEGISALGFAVKDEHGNVYAVSTPVPSSRYLKIKKELAAAIEQNRKRFSQF